jgi:hypothetical protein
LVIALPAIPLNLVFPPATFSPATRPCLFAVVPNFTIQEIIEVVLS